MTLPLVVLRPEPGLTATLVAAHRAGLRASGLPLAAVEPVAWRAPAEPFDGLLLASANAVRHAGAELAKVAHLPALAVGEATARAAAEVGIKVEQVGSGGLQALLDGLPDAPRRLLRLAGENRLEIDPPEAVSVTTVTTYRLRYLLLGAAQARIFADGAVVLLHSGTMAEHFAGECDRLGIAREAIVLAALAPRIARAAGGGWQSVHTAAQPQDGTLLELAARLCQNRAMDGKQAHKGRDRKSGNTAR